MGPNPFLVALHHVLLEKPKLAHYLALQFESLQDLLAQRPAEVDAATLEKLRQFSQEKTQALLADNQIQVVTHDQPEYPPLLKETAWPPLALFYKGDLSLVHRPCLGVVGPRKASEYGLKVTQSLVKTLASQLVIVSGLAQGVDAAAHHTALQHQGKTVAVMGTGFDVLYPEVNRPLFSQLCDKGLVLTEYPWGMPGKAYHFSLRNRLISGMSLGVLVCEAGEKSGSLVSAKYAVEQNREVFAVPGSIFSEFSVGVHALIRDGAKLVHTAQDVLEEFERQLSLDLTYEQPLNEDQSSGQTPVEPELTDEEKKLWICLDGLTEKGVDVLVQQSGMRIHVVLQLLTVWELNGWIDQVSPSHYVKKI